VCRTWCSDYLQTRFYEKIKYNIHGEGGKNHYFNKTWKLFENLDFINNLNPDKDSSIFKVPNRPKKYRMSSSRCMRGSPKIWSSLASQTASKKKKKNVDSNMHTIYDI
jgi:hypothetical protein